ncbi:hypothetical protein A4G99_09220 [Haladaptatus sp. R4]|uniref:hypothetical protein n=1 Tax=Haladaptatus sp. R4 TaxID=1679489 RepID=UPI0007B49854|nr:hypothetical protein [Haladaptatus sp. R4]KZN24542.1 hypothetical protein A4G99_09220 [Haladaptatus sp. R4]
MTSTPLLFDATTLIALGTVGELDLVTHFDGIPVVLPTVRGEITTEPERTNVDRLVSNEGVETDVWLPMTTDPSTDEFDSPAREILGEQERNGDVAIVASVLARTDVDLPIGVVSDDQRVRTVSRGLGATVTGTIGVIVRAVDAELSAEVGKEIVRDVDGHGLHMTGELREKAFDLIDDAATD